MTTYNKISEQIQRIYSRSIDRENLLPLLDKREIRLLVVQVSNQLLSTEVKNAQRIGDLQIPSCSIVSYPNIAVIITTPVFTLSSPVNTTFSLSAGVTTIGSPIISYAAGSIIKVGDLVNHANLPAGTTVLNILSSTAATLSANATATGSGLTFVCWNKNISFASNVQLENGDLISGTGIPAGATITQILSDATAIISANATAAAGANYTINPLRINTSTSYVVALPFIPLRINMDAGVWGIYIGNIPCIPLSSAMMDLMGDTDEALLEQQIGFVVEGSKARFVGSYDLLQKYLPASSTVTIKLLLTDVSTLADDENLPIPPEMEYQIIQECVKLMLAIPKTIEKENG